MNGYLVTVATMKFVFGISNCILGSDTGVGEKETLKSSMFIDISMFFFDRVHQALKDHEEILDHRDRW